jgi:hypothetical protein
MENAGFRLSSEPGIWEVRVERPGFEGEVVVPVDLIVPEKLAPKAGRRSARLAHEHGSRTARKSRGLEGAVVDNGPIQIAALDPADARRITVNVAGPGALVVAKLHKLGDRLAQPERLQAKDAGDVYRLFDAVDAREMAELMRVLCADERSGDVARSALVYARQLFTTPGSIGVQLATRALTGVVPATTVVAAMTAYARVLLENLDT